MISTLKYAESLIPQCGTLSGTEYRLVAARNALVAGRAIFPNHWLANAAGPRFCKNRIAKFV